MNASTDFRVDPLVGDYDGQAITHLSNAVYLRITTPLGSYWQDPRFGSKLHLLQREKALTRVGLLAEQYVRQALQPILDAGRADRVDVELGEIEELNGTARLFLNVSVYQNGTLVAHFERHVAVMQG